LGSARSLVGGASKRGTCSFFFSFFPL
jgi:hypothetical protein